MSAFVVLLAALWLLIVATYLLERWGHRMRTGRMGWTCEGPCSCRGTI